ncbi:unnamed protein product [Cuscuta epithymum]|uniref:ELYS-like domain-containing protein n=1 Tax=Cuscuta epithymum TaxID=186058 RepID=A0AAV0FF08_9ASTE|nr:unnamed protein product [Cuscuta epithymum]
MERRFEESSSIHSPSNINGGSSPLKYSSARPLSYTCPRVQGALEHLASIYPIELCDEAKIERCRATRDLRSCGRNVRSVLRSCKHASLCEECSQRCDVCPICRVSLPKDSNTLQLRLYYECIEAGLISSRCDDRLQEKEDSEKQLSADIQRLYSLFDVALQNNLVCLICHYVTDVCMDESAVSSDPVIAFLLDEVVVKDWCKRTFRNILNETQVIYNDSLQGMEENLSSLLNLSVELTGLSNVIEVLEASFKHSLSAKLHDLHHLQEHILKTKQHMEMMVWCIRHKFLENVTSRFNGNFASWVSLVRERKSAAIRRAWPDSANQSEELSASSTLFIEDALTNLESELCADDYQEEYDIACLQKDGRSSFLRSKIGGMASSYPFQSLRGATDILFLHGSSDLVVAKQAIFLYYIFDRQWTVPDERWRDIVDDFAATFCVSRHSILESCVYFLLDDHTDEGLQEACRLLPEISSPVVHPKVAQVLLERQNPDAALMVLRCSGRDGGQLVSLGEAVTAVRVRVECGLLSEAFMFQRMICAKVNENKLRGETFHDASLEQKGEACSPDLWVETLVSEICCLCVRRNLVDRIIELPWNSDEEIYLHKCLLDFATEDPSTITGSLLVVFYLQRHRYIEAYEIDRKLQTMEDNFISQNSLSETVLTRIRSINNWRTGLARKGVELLPDIIQHQVKAGKLAEAASPNKDKAKDSSAKPDLQVSQGPIFSSLLTHPPADRADNAIISSPHPPAGQANNGIISSLSASSLETSAKYGLSDLSIFKVGNYASPKPHTHSFISSPTTERSSLRVPRSSRLRNYQTNQVSSERIEKVSLNGSVISKKHRSLTEAMDISWSHEEDTNASVRSRWRSDDSEEEDYSTPDRLIGFTSHTMNPSSVRRGRFSLR